MSESRDDKVERSVCCQQFDSCTVDCIPRLHWHDERRIPSAARDIEPWKPREGELFLQHVPAALVGLMCEGVRRAVINGNLDARSMAADAGLLLEKYLTDAVRVAPSHVAPVSRETLESLPHACYGTLNGWTAHYVPVESVLSITPIGEVIGHEQKGLALVQWDDNGLRPVGMKVYAAPVTQSATGDSVTGGTVEQDAARFRFLCRTIRGELKHIGSMFKRWHWDGPHDEPNFMRAIDAALVPSERTVKP